MSPGPGGRVLWRLAWRDARSEPRRPVLIVALVALAVAAATAVAVSSRTTEPTPQERAEATFGAAEAILELHATGPAYERLPAELRAEVDDRLGGPVEPITPAQVTAALSDLAPQVEFARLDEGSLTLEGHRRTSVLIGDPSHPVLGGRLIGDVDVRLGPGEVLASPAALRQLGAAVGDTVELPSLGAVLVAGEVAEPLARSRPVVVTAGGEPAEQLTLGGGVIHSARWHVRSVEPLEAAELVDELRERVLPSLARGRAAAAVDRVVPPGAIVSIRSADRSLQPPGATWSGRHTATGGLVALVLLVQVGFVAAAAFATGTRRRVRELGLLAAAGGAAPDQLRRMVMRQAVILGAIGGACGVALAAAGVVVGRPVLEWLADRPLTGVDWHLADLLLPGLLAVAASVAAAWVPARTVARVPVTAALAGRVPLRRVRRRVTALSIAVALGGAAVIVAATQIQPGAWVESSQLYRQVRPELSPRLVALLRGGAAAAGVTLLLAGTAGLAAPLLQAGARLAARGRLALRLAVRDSARQRTRSAATVAATLVVLTVPVVAMTLAAASDQAAAERREAALDDVVVVTGPLYAGAVQLSPTEEMVAAVRERLRGVERELRVPLLDDRHGDPGVVHLIAAPTERTDASAAPPPGPSPVRGAALATEELLRLVGVVLPDNDAVVVVPNPAFGAHRDPLPGRAVVTRERDGVIATRPGPGAVEVEVINAPRSLGWTMPELLVPPAIADELGATAAAELVILQTAGPVDLDTVRALQREAEAAAVPFQLATAPPGAMAARLWYGGITTLVAVVLSLLIAVLAAALAATETDRDLAAMVAVGADPRIRPRVRALQAGWHALLAGALAVPAGLLLVLALRTAAVLDEPMAVPWALLATMVAVVPALIWLPFRALSRPAPVRLDQRRPT